MLNDFFNNVVSYDPYQIDFSGICRYFRHCSSSLPVLQFPISAIPVGTWVPKIGESNRQPLAMLRPTASLASALNLLVQGVNFLSDLEHSVSKRKATEGKNEDIGILLCFWGIRLMIERALSPTMRQILTYD